MGKCRIPEKQGVYRIEAEKGPLDMAHLFPYLTIKDTELVQKIRMWDGDTVTVRAKRKWRGWSKTLSTVNVKRSVRIENNEMENKTVRRGNESRESEYLNWEMRMEFNYNGQREIETRLENEPQGRAIFLFFLVIPNIYIWMVGREGN